jgi:hypothetical protein
MRLAESVAVRLSSTFRVRPMWPHAAASSSGSKSGDTGQLALAIVSGRDFGRRLIRPRCFGPSTRYKISRKQRHYYPLKSGGHSPFPSLNLRVVGSIPTRLTIFSSGLSERAK